MESPARREAAAARCEVAKAEMVEIDLAQRRGEMTDVEVDARYALVRTRLLGVPLRAAQRLPHLAGERVTVTATAMCSAGSPRPILVVLPMVEGAPTTCGDGRLRAMCIDVGWPHSWLTADRSL
jgi:hypothetical protein